MWPRKPEAKDPACTYQRPGRLETQQAFTVQAGRGKKGKASIRKIDVLVRNGLVG